MKLDMKDEDLNEEDNEEEIALKKNYRRQIEQSFLQKKWKDRLS